MDWLFGKADKDPESSKPISKPQPLPRTSIFSSKTPAASSTSSSSSISSPVDLEPSTKRTHPFLRLHYTNPLLVGLGTTVSLFGGYNFWKRYLRRIPNVDRLTEDRLSGRSTISGIVTSVGDADNFRLYHTPLLHFRKTPAGRTALKDQTLHIRLAGVDAPELAHFGNPAQPFGAEALEWLTNRLHGKKVRVTLYSKDRYGRVVGMAYARKFPWIFRSNISEEMLKAGFATVYTQQGAVHGGLLQKFEALEKTAKAKKKGMWAQSSKKYISPADFKAKHSKVVS